LKAGSDSLSRDKAVVGCKENDRAVLRLLGCVGLKEVGFDPRAVVEVDIDLGKRVGVGPVGQDGNKDVGYSRPRKGDTVTRQKDR
jgi:hypothetical protein